MILLMIISIFSYGLMHAIEIASFGTRVAGRVSDRVALGTTLQQTIYTTSRFLLIPFLPTLGYLVESGIHMDKYLYIVFLSILIGFVFENVVYVCGRNSMSYHEYFVFSPS